MDWMNVSLTLLKVPEGVLVYFDILGKMKR